MQFLNPVHFATPIVATEGSFLDLVGFCAFNCVGKGKFQGASFPVIGNLWGSGEAQEKPGRTITRMNNCCL